jgi:dye decolorizing peroxidase
MPGSTLPRRALLLGGAAAAAAGGTAAVLAARDVDAEVTPVAPAGGESVPFHGAHQPGIDTLPAQAHAVFIGVDLRPGSGTADVRRLMRLLSDDAARLMSGHAPLAAEDPELPALPSRLTVTFGFGARPVRRGRAWPGLPRGRPRAACVPDRSARPALVGR